MPSRPVGAHDEPNRNSAPIDLPFAGPLSKGRNSHSTAPVIRLQVIHKTEHRQALILAEFSSLSGI